MPGFALKNFRIPASIFIKKFKGIYMMNCFVDKGPAITLELVTELDFDKFILKQSAPVQTLLRQQQFTAKQKQFALIRNNAGELEKVIAGIGNGTDIWAIGALPKKLPPLIYQLAESTPKAMQEMAAFVWSYAAYSFNVYRHKIPTVAQLLLPPDQRTFIQAITETQYLVRDLINTPANDMGPGELADALENLAKEYQADFKQIIDAELLEQNFPMIYAVGEGSNRAPRLLELKHGNPNHFKLTLVGKGVCFDTGGLNIKTEGAMNTMKKDMGGAAHVIGLAKLIMQMQLPIYLHVLVPAVENSISGASYRPGDVLIARNGLSIEITNTDAEGRLVLADALVEASRYKPDLLIDFATLTGAARVALGPDVSPFMTTNPALAIELCAAGNDAADPLWPLPLHQDYNRYLTSTIADKVNASKMPFAGAITAALFLQNFVDNDIDWVHFDIFAWHAETLPGKEVGAGMCALRAVYQYLCGQL